MNTYLFHTVATMKEYNNKKWWIDSNIIKDIKIQSESLKEALNKYKEFINEDAYVLISENAIKNKKPMFIDTKNGEKQIGYVITGKTEFEDRYNYKWSMQYIDLWISVSIISDVEEWEG